MLVGETVKDRNIVFSESERGRERKNICVRESVYVFIDWIRLFAFTQSLFAPKNGQSQ